MDVIHTAISVSDLDESEGFYVDGLGLKRDREFTTEDGVRSVFFAGDHGEVQCKFDPTAEEVPAPAGFDHLAIGVEDIQAAFDRVTSVTECPVTSEPEPAEDLGIIYAFIEDPDGYAVELIESVD